MLKRVPSVRRKIENVKYNYWYNDINNNEPPKKSLKTVLVEYITNIFNFIFEVILIVLTGFFTSVINIVSFVYITVIYIVLVIWFFLLLEFVVHNFMAIMIILFFLYSYINNINV